MNPTIILKSLLGMVCAGLITIPLFADAPAASPGTYGSVAGEGAAQPKLCGAEAKSPTGDGPIRGIHAHVCGFHFYSGAMNRALRADHYCSHLNQDVFQCIIYDSNERNARLVGVEYIISETLFNQLPGDEKKLWHSHRYEVMSGQLVAPDLSDVAEQALMKELVGTYGKTWYLWQVDRGDKLPLGLPKLMMGFTGDDQANPQMVAGRDRDLNLNATVLKSRRAGLATRPVANGADGWQNGQAFQIDDSLLKQPQTGFKP